MSGVGVDHVTAVRADLRAPRKRIKLFESDTSDHTRIANSIPLSSVMLMSQIHADSVKLAHTICNLIEQSEATVDVGRLIASMESIRQASREACDALTLNHIVE